MIENILNLYGTPTEMGKQHGEECSKLIHELAEERIEVILDSNRKITINMVESIACQIEGEILLQQPLVYEEISATAESANIKLWELIVAGGYSDVEDNVARLISPYKIKDTNECTLLPCRIGKFAVILGTWDSHASAQPYLMVIKRYPKNGVSTLALSTAGWPMQQGITSNGIGFAITNMGARYCHIGSSYIASLPYFINSRSLKDCKKKMIQQRLCSARHYSLVDSSGNYLGVETDGIEYHFSNKLTPHTNHFIYSDAMYLEGRHELVVESEQRRQLAKELLLNQTSDLLNMIGYREDRNNIVKIEKDRQTSTCCGFVLNPLNKSIEYSYGPPGVSRTFKHFLN